MDLFNFPVDIGRYYMMNWLPGTCTDYPLGTIDYDVSHVVIINIRTWAVECKEESLDDICGDGIRTAASNEACDDGNFKNGDGCNQACEIEYGWLCTSVDLALSTCELNPCHDGVVDTAIGETCDDGDLESGDGCSSTCQLEIYWYCDDASP